MTDNNRPGEVERGQRPKCDACGIKFTAKATYRTDDDGFTGCFPCFPVSNLDKDKDRFLRGPCYRKVAVLTQQEKTDAE